ncbi:MAG: ParB/RepB/Spo0J family partition protein [Deltaproteobacteria bacterium]|nr:ParB/RepB/Spo0J family partition protein [Deltaproteobacteria bacterium]
MSKHKALGRGLSSLIPDSSTPLRDGAYLLCPIDLIEANEEQPRRHFSEPQLRDLAQSIHQHGILQPIIVKHNEQNKYTIVAGERRWRAAKLADLKQVPIIVQDVSADRALQLALVENIQREDLNCIEEAEAYHQLQQKFSLKQEEISEQVGKDRSTIANYLRLLSLPSDIREDLIAARLTMGHARALLSLKNPERDLQRVKKIIAEKTLSVRQTEMLVQQCNQPPLAEEAHQPPDSPFSGIAQIVKSLSSRLKTRVEVKSLPKGAGGKIVIHFQSDKDLKRLHSLLDPL